MYTVNKKVACTPYPSTDTKSEARGGLPVIKQKRDLTALQVVYDYRDAEGDIYYAAGDTVWVLGETCKHTFAKEQFELEEGKPFVLIPVELMLVVKDYSEK